MANLTLDDLAFQQQFEQAQATAAEANQNEPRAVAAYYEPKDHLIVIHLRSGGLF